MTQTMFEKLCIAAALLVVACCAGCSDMSASRAGNSIADADVPEPSEGETAASKPAADSKIEEPERVEGAVATDIPPAADVPRRARNITFDTIKFDMEKRDRFVKSMLTPTIKVLDGRRVKIRGFMLPTSVRAGISNFILVRDNLECCFGPGAALFDAIAVQMRDNETTEYAYFPITVEGVFHIDPIENPLYGQAPLENSHLYIFRVDDALVSNR